MAMMLTIPDLGRRPDFSVRILFQFDGPISLPCPAPGPHQPPQYAKAKNAILMNSRDRNLPDDTILTAAGVSTPVEAVDIICRAVLAVPAGRDQDMSQPCTASISTFVRIFQ
jgi:hypothetical protein